MTVRRTVFALMVFAAGAGAQTYEISTIAGRSPMQVGESATAFGLSPRGVAVDGAGNVYMTDWETDRIYVVNNSGVIIKRFGTGHRGFAGDGGNAANADLNEPAGLALDAAGNLYISDYGNGRIRKVAAGTELITTVAGGGSLPGPGDNVPAVGATVAPMGVAVDAAGNLYIADPLAARIRKVSAATGLISTVAGNAHRL